MKSEIIIPNYMNKKDGYIGVFCRCGNTLYVRNDPSKAREQVAIECPCGSVIETIYTKD